MLMGVAQLAKVSIVLPRSQMTDLLRELAIFDWFHPLQSPSRDSDQNLDALASRALRVFVELNDLLEPLAIKTEPGIIETLVKGPNEQVEKWSTKDWENLLTQLETKSVPLIRELRDLLDEVGSVEKRVEDLESIGSALSRISKFSTDLEKLTHLKRFHIVFALGVTKDIREIASSMPGAIALHSPVTKSDSIILVAAPKDDSERVEKVLRSFEVRPFSIPSDLPQTPKEAFEVVQTNLQIEQEKLANVKKSLTELSTRSEQKILTFRETAQLSHEVFSKMRRAGPLQRFAVIEGYIPAQEAASFRSISSKWITIVKTVSTHDHQDSEGDSPPTQLQNPLGARAFEAVTLTQGPPRYGEIDPTSLISLMFPIFFGVMFGDLGHGLVLLLFGLFLAIRGTPSIKKWGQIFMAAGISASVVGVLIGEFFGLPTHDISPAFDGLLLLHFVERHHAIPSINIEALLVFIQISLVFGIIQITLGLTLDVINATRKKEYVELAVEKIPTLTLYVFGVLFALAFIGAGNSFDGLLESTSPIPLLPIPVATAGTIGVIGGITSVIVLVLGKGLAMVAGKLPSGSVGMTIFESLIEVMFERMAGFLANTVSYARIAILLTVHASLLIALNLAWNLPLVAAIPMLIVFNVLIIMMEGMIVYIQDLRLHLYEWFTKFYDGSGSLFNKMVPDKKFITIEWERKSTA